MSQSGTTPKPAAPVSHFEQQKSSAGSNMASKSTAAGSDSKTTTAATTVKVEPAKSTKPSTTTMPTATTASTTTTTSTTTTASAAAASKASATKAEQTKVQVEVPPKAPESKKPAPAPPLDPLDALASSLPSAAPKRPEPKYTGPEVKEGVTSEKGVLVGVREDTLPPGYRLQDMAPPLADTKPADVPKPMSTDEALDVLSFGFSSETQQTNVETVSAKTSKSQSSFAPAPPKTRTPLAPPADKKPKLDSAADSFSLSAAVPAAKASAPSGDKKAPASKAPPPSVTPPASGLSLDALSALEDLLPSAEPPKPEAPLRPEDLVSEATVTEEEGVRVGEREDTLPPEYRLKPEDLRSSSRPSPQPSLDTAQALDILSGDFSSSSAPSTHSAAPAQKPLSPAPPADKKPRVETGGFSLEGGLSPSSAQKVASASAPLQKSETKTTKSDSKSTKSSAKDVPDSRPAPDQGGPMSLDALSALEDLLPSAEPPKPEAPLRPEDLVSEATVTEEEGVRVGEREDTLPPEYRLKPEDLRSSSRPSPQPSLDTAQALDILSGDFSSSSAPSTHSAAPAQSTVPAAQTLTALDSQDFVSSSKTAPVQAPPPSTKSAPKAVVSVRSKTEDEKRAKATETVLKHEQANAEKAPPADIKAPASKAPPPGATPPASGLSLDALSALEDLLPSAEPPKPEAPLRPEDLVSEATVTEEEGVRVGEREDTLPPEYRLKPEDLRSSSRPSPQPSLDTAQALDILSGDFSSSSAPSTHSAAPAQSSAHDAALDALSGDFFAPSAAPTVRSSAPPHGSELSGDADFALEALSDSLKDIAPTPQPESPMPKDIVKEKEVEEERLIKMGERDDTLPPEYRPTQEERKKMAEEKDKSPKEKPMDDKTALDLLAGDFSAPAISAPVSSAPVSSAPVSSAPVSSAPTNVNKPMPGKVLDSLYETLLPETTDSKKTEKTKKSPVESAVDLPPSQRSSDVVPSSTKES